MEVQTLDHVNVRTRQLPSMIAWYEDILGLEVGPRPDFNFPGAWLYAGGRAFVHLVGTEDAGAAGSEGALKLEHFAFRAKDARGFEQRLLARGENFRRVEITETNTVAFNIWDPDGNHIHVDFDLSE